MALGMELRLRMAQQLVMTPQLQLAIRLLQMSNLELDEFLQEELDKNPLLEREEGAEDSEFPGLSASEGSGATTPSQESDREIQTEPNRLDDDLQVDASWNDIYDEPTGIGYVAQSSADPGESSSLENTLSTSETLVDHLVWQLNLTTSLTERERALGLYLIDAIDDNGYLGTDLATLAEMVQASLEELEDVLALIHTFDPPGVGAQSLAECLFLQLKSRGMGHPPYSHLLNHLPDLARRDYRKLTRKLRLTESELSKAVAVIQSLNPKPGLAFGSDTARYIMPDVLVRKNHRGVWTVEMNPEMSPRIRVNSHYQNLGKGISSQDQRFLNENMRSARWLLKSLEQRSNTIFRVAESIVRFQTDFLEEGPEALKPLILKDVADDIGVHESTISRVTSNKYMHTPRGVYELKYFFSSSLTGGLGATHSSESVRHKIRKLIEEEPTSRPYSDEQLVEMLNLQGITVARRTVAKYREAMGILPSSRRKRL